MERGAAFNTTAGSVENGSRLVAAAAGGWSCSSSLASSSLFGESSRGLVEANGANPTRSDNFKYAVKNRN